MRIPVALAIVAGLSLPAHTQENDSHAGYYYPAPQSSEVYVSRLATLPDANKRTRVGFTVGLNARQMQRAYAPTYHLFAKGAHAQKLIIVATGRRHYDTLYRMRGLLAAMTADARTSPLFRNLASPENINFFDLAKMTGFEQITVTDGENFAHRIKLP